VHRFAHKVPVILVKFQQNLNFREIFSKKPSVSKFTKIRSVRSELFHADTERRPDGRIDRQTWRS